MNRNLVGSAYVRFCIRFPQNKMKGERPEPLALVSKSHNIGEIIWFLLNRNHPICFDSFGQAVSEEKICFNQPIRNKNCLRWPCLLTDQDKMSYLYRGPSIDASYQFRFTWPSGFRWEDLFSMYVAHFVPICLQTWPPQAILVSEWSI
jgi:hypothetical protein